MTPEQADELSAAIRVALDLAHEEGLNGTLTEAGLAAEERVWEILKRLTDGR